MTLDKVTVWIWDGYIADPEIQREIKDFGGLCVFGENAKKLDNHSLKNLYDWNDEPRNPDKKHYYGEFFTRRQSFPDDAFYSSYGDESSPCRLESLKPHIVNLGYSSYRTTLFTIPTRSSDINIRVPILSSVHTLKQLHKKYGAVHSFIWIDLKKNLYFCYPYKTFLDPNQKEKSWSFKPFLKIPFGFHVKRMVKFAKKYNKRVFIYAGDYDVSKEDLLKRLKIIKQYFN